MYVKPLPRYVFSCLSEKLFSLYTSPLSNTAIGSCWDENHLVNWFEGIRGELGGFGADRREEMGHTKTEKKKNL